MIKYTYIFVRMNMLPVQVTVQACHAALEMGLKEGVTEHPHLLLIGVDEEEDLRKVLKLLLNNKIKVYCFIEPDMNESFTAFATVPIPEDHSIREKLKQYKLLPPFIHNKGNI